LAGSTNRYIQDRTTDTLSHYLAFLAEAAQDFVESEDPLSVLHARFQQLAGLIGLAGYEWYSFNDHQQLALTATRGIRESVDEQDGPNSMPGEAFSRHVSQDRRPLLHYSIESLTDAATASLRKLGITGFFSFPLIHGQTAFGVVSFATRRPGGWTDEARLLLYMVTLCWASALGGRTSATETERGGHRDLPREQSLTKLRALAAEHTVRDQEARRQIARELREQLVNPLALGRMKLGHVIRQTTTASISALLHDVDHVIDQAVKFTETFTRNLSPGVEQEQGFQPALQWLATRMEKEGLIVTLRLPAQPPMLGGDTAIVLFQSVRELLFNVLKHAGTRRASVTVTHERTGHLQVSVGDTGRGFDAAEVEQVAEPHSGFGLFSIREHMALLNGRMEIRSGPEQGTRVTLIVPAGSAPTTEDPQDGHQDHPERLRVLLVDDHAMVREGLRSILEGYQDLEVIGEAGDGIEAVKLARTRHPDVVVMDINMPRLDGIAATRQIKHDHPSTAVIGISIQDSSQVEQAMLSAGATTFLRKDRAASHLHDAILQAR
jgi:signal transduction histidine kinase/CheY-like chemotaxis protein